MQMNDDGKPTVDKCNVYDLDYASLNKLSIEQGTSANELFGQNLTTKNCTNFEYDNSEIESSIVTDVSFIAQFSCSQAFSDFPLLHFSSRYNLVYVYKTTGDERPPGIENPLG